MPTVVTIGVYGFNRATFLAALQDAGVKLLLDVRQRRGVRGSEYAWANSARLQAALADAGIAYRHHRSWPPPRSSAASSTPRTSGGGRQTFACGARA